MKYEVSNINIITSDYTSESDFWINVHVDISELDSQGAETISVHVVSSERLKSICMNEDVIGRSKIFVREFDIKAIEQTVNKLIKSLNATDWDGVYTGLNKYFDFV